MNVKIEIIDNQITGIFEVKNFEFKKPNWFQKARWVYTHGTIIGKNYMCPEVHLKRITIEDLCKREVKDIINFYNKGNTITEIHNTVVTKEYKR